MSKKNEPANTPVHIENNKMINCSVELKSLSESSVENNHVFDINTGLSLAD